MWPRILASAALAAVQLASGITVLALILNPSFDSSANAGALLAALFLPYWVVATLALLFVLRLISAVEWWPRAHQPPVEELPWFASLLFFSVSATAGLYWFNRYAYEDSISLASLHALELSAMGLSLLVVLLVALGVSLLAFPYRRRGAHSALIVLVFGAALAVPLALRPEPATGADPVKLATEPVAPARRIILVGVDGLGADALRAGASSGRLPVFASLLRRGAFASLATLQPTEGPPIWASIFTGRSPRAHGVKSFVDYRLLGSGPPMKLLPKGVLVSGLEGLRLVTRSAVTAASRECRALWHALNAFGIQTGVVRFWGTHPPEHVSGFMLSNYFHALGEDPVRRREALFPPDLADEIQARAVSFDAVESSLGRFVDASVSGDAVDEELERELLERALARDLTYKRAGEVLRAAYQPDFFATYFYGADIVGHSFQRFANPESFGDVGPEEVRRYGDVIERYSAQLGEWIGEIHESLEPDEVLLVVSGYGMRPVPLWRRVITGVLGGSSMSGSHAGAPPGFLIAVGGGIRPRTEMLGASVLDVTPTVLYLMGLPVARDMEGIVLTGMLDESFARAHPVTYIPSYESLAVTEPPQSPVDVPPLEDQEPVQ